MQRRRGHRVHDVQQDQRRGQRHGDQRVPLEPRDDRVRGRLLLLGLHYHAAAGRFPRLALPGQPALRYRHLPLLLPQPAHPRRNNPRPQGGHRRQGHAGDIFKNIFFLLYKQR